MRLIPEQDIHAGIKMYRENPDLSYETVAKRHNISATTLRRKNLEATANNGHLNPVQIGGPRYSADLETYHCEICLLIYELGWCVSHRQLADELKSRFNIDVSHELLRNYRKTHQLPHKRVNPIQKVGKWSNITKVIDDNGEIRPVARLQVESGLLQRTAGDQGGKQYSPQQRTNVMHDIVKKGMTVKDAAKKHDVNEKAIYVWNKTYQTTGRLQRKKRAENYSTVDLSQYPVLVTAKNNPSMTYQELQAWLLQEHKVQCSVGKIRRYLLKHGIPRQLKRQQPPLTFPAPIVFKPKLNRGTSRDRANVVVHDPLNISKQIPSRVLNQLLHEMISYWQGFLQHFGTLTDVRTAHAVDHQLASILFMTLLNGMVAPSHAENVNRFGTEHRLQWIRPILGDHAFQSMPTSKTICELMRQIDPLEFSKCLIEFTKFRRQQFGFPMTGLNIAWDAKTSRGSKDGPNRDYTHTGSLMDHRTRESLAVLATGRLAKETKTLLEIINAGIIPVNGNMITADALHGKPAVTEAISNRGGDYFLGLKTNHAIFHDCELIYDMHSYYSEFQQQDQQRPSTTRTCRVHDVPDQIRDRHPKWKNWQTVIFYTVTDPTRKKQKKAPNHPNEIQFLPPNTRIYLCSKRPSAEESTQISRGHWGIEQNHHLLDVAMKEDHHQARKNNAAMNWTINNRLSLNELHRSRGHEPISGVQRYGDGNILNLFAQLTQFHKKYPDDAEFFDFK